MSERYKVTDEDRIGKTYIDINYINNLTIKDNKLIFNKVSFETSGTVKRPINIEFLKHGIEINSILVANSEDVKIIEFDMCILYKINIESASSIIDLKIKNSIILDRFILKNKIFNELNLEHSKFYQKVKIQECTIKNETSFFNTSFKELADFYRTKFNEVVFERADFEKISVFSESEFNQDIDFKYTKFLGLVVFRDTVIKGKLNLRNTIFDGEANFLDMTSKKRKKGKNKEYYGEPKIIDVSNRETARIIKYFYEDSKNIIESNKFYALEMEKREEELRETITIKNIQSFFEWLIFNVHSVVSNHSQDWIQSLLWIMVIVLSYVTSISEIIVDKELILNSVGIILIISVFVEQVLYKKNIIKITLASIIILFYVFIDIDLNIFAKHINPFSKIGTDITYSILIFKIVMAYLIYQFIVSVRQNTRRK